MIIDRIIGEVAEVTGFKRLGAFKDDWVRELEAMFIHRLRLPIMRHDVNMVTGTPGLFRLPADYAGVVAVRDADGNELRRRSPAQLRAGDEGFAIDGDFLRTNPPLGNVLMEYYKAIPSALTTDNIFVTNWPHVYRLGLMMKVAEAQGQAEIARAYLQALLQALGQIEADAARDTFVKQQLFDGLPEGAAEA